MEMELKLRFGLFGFQKMKNKSENFFNDVDSGCGASDVRHLRLGIRDGQREDADICFGISVSYIALEHSNIVHGTMIQY
jgi:hypothetical protein